MTTTTTTDAPRILRLAEVMARTALKRDTVYRKVKSGEFPAPLKLTSHASGWVESEVTDWILARAAARNADRSAAA